MIPLFGHEAAVAEFRKSLDGGKLHHAWLISGPQGIGKASFAAKAALRVLARGQGRWSFPVSTCRTIIPPPTSSPPAVIRI